MLYWRKRQVKHIKIEKVPKWVLFIFCLLCAAGSIVALVFRRRKKKQKR